jgi:hypothetical protein
LATQKHKRSHVELKDELEKQLRVLRVLCKSFDEDCEDVYVSIATSIRVLLHDGERRSKSRALLTQLGCRRDMLFVDSCGEVNPHNLMTSHLLCAAQIGSPEGAKYVPLGSRVVKKVRFPSWWNSNVIKDKVGNLFCRKDIVITVANQDGGAHVDTEILMSHKQLSKDNSLGWLWSSGNSRDNQMGNPIPACMRQIATEVIASIENYTKFNPL